MKRIFVLLLVQLFVILMPVANLNSSALALDQAAPAASAELFAVHCAGCHVNGGNIVRRNKTLKLKALQKNKMDSLAAVTEIVTNGKGNMSAYKDRLTQDEIQAVAIYVLQQAQAGWKAH